MRSHRLAVVLRAEALPFAIGVAGIAAGLLLGYIVFATSLAESFEADPGIPPAWDGQRRRDQGEWEDEIVHRWAHAMQTQRRVTVRRYGLAAHAVWRRPRRGRRARRTRSSA